MARKDDTAEIPLSSIGDFPERWVQSTLGKACALVTDGTHDSPKESVEGFPLVTGKCITGGRINLTEAYLISEIDHNAVIARSKPEFGDILFANIGNSIGELARVETYAEFSIKNVALFKPSPKLESRYLKYYLGSPAVQSYIRGNTFGSAQPFIGLGTLRAFPVPLPPLPEQKGIAAVLGALDDKIELNRRMNATLEAMARTLFQSWFVDFDPVRAKLDGRKPAGLDAATAALFPAHFQDSPIGHIPQGWEVTMLGACIGFRSGFSFKSQDWQESGVPVVKIGSVKPGIIDLSQVSYVSDEIAQQAARYRLNVGDMLIGMTGYVGEVGLVPPTDNLPLLNQRVGKFVLPKPGTESLPFWYCTTRQPEFRAFVEARSHGTAQANVSGEAIMEFPLIMPPADILSAFNAACKPILDQILCNHARSRTLATLRDTLLPKLLSGDISVANVESDVASV